MTTDERISDEKYNMVEATIISALLAGKIWTTGKWRIITI